MLWRQQCRYLGVCLGVDDLDTKLQRIIGQLEIDWQLTYFDIKQLINRCAEDACVKVELHDRSPKQLTGESINSHRQLAYFQSSNWHLFLPIGWLPLAVNFCIYFTFSQTDIQKCRRGFVVVGWSAMYRGKPFDVKYHQITQKCLINYLFKFSRRITLISRITNISTLIHQRRLITAKYYHMAGDA